jgi:hypothetical protein
LAVDTGGMQSKWSNDLALGYTRAKRALSCVYTVGFYLDNYEEDDPESIIIAMNDPSMRAIHPSKYVVRSLAARRESTMTAAWNAPELFRTGVVRAHAFPLRPASKAAWEVLLAVRFPVPLSGEVGKEAQSDFGGVLREGPRIRHRFNRRVTVRPTAETDNVEPEFTYVERVELPPGTYELTVVMDRVDGSGQHVDRVNVTVPEIPRKQLFVAGPTLGRPVGDDLVVLAESNDSRDDRRAGSASFAPLLVQYLEEPHDLIFLSDACLVGSEKAVQRARQLGVEVRRGLNDAGGAELASIRPLPLDLEGSGNVRCQAVVDVLPSSVLTSGDFVFEARLGDETGSVGFTVELD